MSGFAHLSAPIRVCQKEIKNRLVVPAMADFGMTGPDGLINQRHIERYGAYARECRTCMWYIDGRKCLVARARKQVEGKKQDQDLADRFLTDPDTGKCSIFHEGQEFIVTKENYNNFPYENHFCGAAWDVIKIKVYSALQGGNFYWEGWMKNTTEQILCCDDGIRPVIFLLERIEEE